MSVKKLGTKETKEMLGFILGLGNALGASLVDGKITIGDAHRFVEALLSSGAAFQDADQVPAELADLDEAERADLLDYAKTTFDIPQDKVEEVVEAAFVVLADVHALALKVKAALPAKA